MSRKRANAETDGSKPTKKPKTGKSGYSSPAIAETLAQWRVEDLPGGEVYYMPELVSEKEANEWYEELEKLDVWYHPTLKVYGKDVRQSRSIAAYASSSSITVKYSGHTVDLHTTYPSILTKIQTCVSSLLRLSDSEPFNHVMLNWYASGEEYIGRHRDTADNKVIASLSLGSRRIFVLTPSNFNKDGKPKKVVLGNGSLLVMQGDTQKNWRHEIPKEPHVKGGRISLTFRQLYSAES